MLRRLIIAGTVSAAGLGGFFLASAPAAHADGQVCVNLQGSIAGNQLPGVDQCQSLPALPTPPSLP